MSEEQLKQVEQERDEARTLNRQLAHTKKRDNEELAARERQAKAQRDALAKALWKYAKLQQDPTIRQAMFATALQAFGPPDPRLDKRAACDCVDSSYAYELDHGDKRFSAEQVSEEEAWAELEARQAEQSKERNG